MPYIFGQEAKVGENTVRNGGAIMGVNNSGGDITTGQCAVIDLSSTNSRQTVSSIISSGTSTYPYPVVIAAGLVQNGSTGRFFTTGGVLALVDSSVSSTNAFLAAGTANATGGNSLITSSTTNKNNCGHTLGASSNGTTPMLVIMWGLAPAMGAQ